MAINRDKILKGAEKLVQKGKVEQAIREYEKLLNLNRNDVNTINRVGDLYNRIGQTDKAVELYQRIADTFADDGFASKAIAIYKKINRLAPDRVDIFQKLAELYIEQGLIFEAQNQYQVLADWFVKNEDFESGISTLRKLVEIDADNHMAHLRLADLLFRTGASEEAMGVYERLGTMLLSNAKVDEAERLFRHAIDQNPPEGEFLIPICEALIDNGNVASAREFLGVGLKKSPQSPRLRVLGLRLALATGDSSSGLETAKQLLTQFPDDSEVLSLAGRALLAGGEGAEGRDVLVPLARRMIDDGDRMGAQEIFRNLIKAMPQDRDILDLGIKALDENEDSEMIFTLRAALADNFFRAGERDEARRLYSELQQDEPDNALFAARIQEIDGGPAAGEDLVAEVVVEDLSFGEADEVEAMPDVAFGAPEPQVEVVEIDEPAPSGIEGGAPAPVGVAEEADRPASAGFDPQERLAEANVFAKYGLVDKAILHLEKILETFPEELEAREKLVGLAIEAGRDDIAAREAPVLAEAFRRDGLETKLQSLIQDFPQLVGAEPEAVVVETPIDEEADVVVEELEIEDIDVLEVPAEAEEEFPELEEIFETDAESEVDEIEFEPVEIEQREAVEPSEGLDFEEVSQDDFDSHTAPAVEPDDSIELGEAEKPTFESDDFTDPDSAPEVVSEPVDPVDPGTVQELPSFDVDSSSSNVLEDLAQLEESVLGSGVALPPDPAPESEIVVEEPERVGPALGDIEQLDSFFQSALYEDAARLLSRLEREYPGDSHLAERRLELKSQGFLIQEMPTETEASEDLFADEAEDYVDLAAELEEELAAEESVVEVKGTAQSGEAELEEVFREFQKGVAQQLSEEDSDTHFNLGIAYKEMGLLPEAIREFQIASRDESFFVECCSMIGVCYTEQGMWNEAAPWYRKALSSPGLPQESMIALKYDLADVLDSAGDHESAADLFEEIQGIKPDFRDVSVRLDGLGRQQYAN